MRSRRLERRLFWTAVFLALALLALAGIVVRAAGALVPAARRPFAARAGETASRRHRIGAAS